jgi:DNA-binding MarR family transcriptional regulator
VKGHDLACAEIATIRLLAPYAPAARIARKLGLHRHTVARHIDALLRAGAEVGTPVVMPKSETLRRGGFR